MSDSEGPELPRYPQGQESTLPSDRLGLIALAVVIAGTVIACLPKVFVVGWILLAIGLGMAIVALRRPSRSHRAAGAAVIVSIVGVVIAAFAFVVMMLWAFQNAKERSEAVGEPGSRVVLAHHTDQAAPAVSMIQASSQARSFHAA